MVRVTLEQRTSVVAIGITGIAVLVEIGILVEIVISCEIMISKEIARESHRTRHVANH